jgi:hypothetical protein
MIFGIEPFDIAKEPQNWYLLSREFYISARIPHLSSQRISPVIKPYLCFRFFFSPKRNGSPKKLVITNDYFYF